MGMTDRSLPSWANSPLSAAWPASLGYPELALLARLVFDRAGRLVEMGAFCTVSAWTALVCTRALTHAPIWGRCSSSGTSACVLAAGYPRGLPSLNRDPSPVSPFLRPRVAAHLQTRDKLRFASPWAGALGVAATAPLSAASALFACALGAPVQPLLGAPFFAPAFVRPTMHWPAAGPRMRSGVRGAGSTRSYQQKMPLPRAGESAPEAGDSVPYETAWPQMARRLRASVHPCALTSRVS